VCAVLLLENKVIADSFLVLGWFSVKRHRKSGIIRVGIVQNLKEFSENTGNLNLKNKREE
jgi:hypothetical protein